MNTHTTTCSRCATPLPPDAPRGHCPACLLTLGLAVAETSLPADATPLKPGDHVGRYQLGDVIGEGGCGIVFLARQRVPIQRAVALKIIKPGMDTRQVIARFEAERQALAMLDHPHIARVFDAGATDAGRSFFVMEFVRGEKITTYCDREKLSFPERLKLFIKVCGAVQHAHEQGIVHRDLKPSNILVTKIAGAEASPKIIDFGIAKSLAEPLTDKTLFTAFTQFIGTPACMSPEQAGSPALEIDGRSDVYSLGVLLYELLTGHTPFDAADLRRLAPDELLRFIREREPLRPSARFANLPPAEKNRLAESRCAGSVSLLESLRGDLDWIAMKCLEKERQRRYQSASALITDIKRHLADEPVAAHRPEIRYRINKMICRHRPAFAAAAALTIALAIGLCASIYQAWRARTEAQRSGQIISYVADVLKGTKPKAGHAADIASLRRVVDCAAARATRDLAGQPGALARVRNLLAESYRDLGLYHDMQAMARDALRLNRAGSTGDNPLTAKSLELLGDSSMHLQKLAEAEAIDRQALAMRQELLHEPHPDICVSLNNLALVLRERGSLDEAEKLFRQSLAMDRALFGEQHPRALSGLNNLGGILWSEGRLAEAETVYRELVALQRNKAGGDTPSLASALNNLAGVLAEEGKLDEAEELNRQAVLMDRRLPGRDVQLAVALENLLNILLAENRFAAAKVAETEARSIKMAQ